MSYLTYNDFYSDSKDRNKNIMKYGDICYATIYNTITNKEIGTLDGSVYKGYGVSYLVGAGCPPDPFTKDPSDTYKKIQIQLIPGSANDTEGEIGPWSKRMYTPVKTTDFFFINVGLSEIINEIPENPPKRNYTDQWLVNYDNSYAWIGNAYYKYDTFNNWTQGKTQLLNKDESIVEDIEYDKYYYIQHNDNKGNKFKWRNIDGKCGIVYNSGDIVKIKFTYLGGPVTDYMSAYDLGKQLCNNRLVDYDDLVKYGFLLEGGIGKKYTSKQLTIIDNKKYYQITTEAVPSYSRIKRVESQSWLGQSASCARFPCWLQRFQR